MKISLLLGALLLSAPALATDVINQDAKAYKVTILDGSVTSTKSVGARGSVYGLCTSGPCTFSIKGSKVTAGKNDRLVISGGVIKKQ